MRQSEILLGNTGEAVATTGQPIFVYGGRVFTVAMHTSNLTGIVTIEATLSADPDDFDWFPVVPPFTFPDQGSATNRTTGFSFTGRFAAIRASLSRPGIPDDANLSGSLGYVDRILLGRIN